MTVQHCVDVHEAVYPYHAQDADDEVQGGNFGAPAGTIGHYIGRNMTVARPNVPKVPTGALLSSGKP